MDIKYVNEEVKKFQTHCLSMLYGMDLGWVDLDFSAKDENTLQITANGKTLARTHQFSIISTIKDGQMTVCFYVDGGLFVRSENIPSYTEFVRTAGYRIVSHLADKAREGAPEWVWTENVFQDSYESEKKDYVTGFFNYYQKHSDDYCDVFEAWNDYSAETISDQNLDIAAEVVDEMSRMKKDDALVCLLPYYEDEVVQNVLENADWKDVSLDNGPELHVSMMVDSGNWNYDLNCDNWQALSGNDADRKERSSLLWLARKLGKEKEWEDLLARYKEADPDEEVRPDDPVLNSMLEEMELLSDLGTVTFLVRLSLRDVLCVIDAQQKKENRTVTLSKKSTCGLFDPLNGSGSWLGIELGQELTIPVSDVRISINGVKDRLHDVDDVYGLVSSVWKVPDAIDGVSGDAAPVNAD